MKTQHANEVKHLESLFSELGMLDGLSHSSVVPALGKQSQEVICSHIVSLRPARDT